LNIYENELILTFNIFAVIEQPLTLYVMVLFDS